MRRGAWLTCSAKCGPGWIGRRQSLQFPITQTELAEALGISAVHVNRVIQSFRAEGILNIQRSKVTLRNMEQLLKIGGFNDLYLHQR